jgi:hypothetical protein
LVLLSDWKGLVGGRTDSFDALMAITINAAPGPGTWSGPLRVTASDGRDYFVKTLEACPQPDDRPSLAIEQIVSRVGRLIGAPVCETSLIRIPDQLAGWPTARGMPLASGLAHASLAIERADFRRPPLEERMSDDNQRRHVGVYALCDWCFSCDEQWLYDVDNGLAVYSHDHGLYFPPVGRGFWTRDELVANAALAHEWRDPRGGLSPQATQEVGDALDRISQAELVEVLQDIPASWPVSDDELEALGWFLEHRAPAVAGRVRALA